MNQLYVTHVPGLQGIGATGVEGGVIKVQAKYAGGSFRAAITPVPSPQNNRNTEECLGTISLGGATKRVNGHQQ